MNTLELAEEAGLGRERWNTEKHLHDFLDRFAALVAAHEHKKCEQEMILMEEHCAELILIEREACAKVCDKIEQDAERYGTDCCKWPTPFDCAAAIRARVETK